MKAQKHIAIAGLAILFIIFALTVPALALDSMVTAPIASVDTLIDKNGNEYVRVVITEDRSLNGVKYETEALVMAFGRQVEAAKTLKPGDTFKGICNSREYQGRLSYTVLKVIK